MAAGPLGANSFAGPSLRGEDIRIIRASGRGALHHRAGLDTPSLAFVHCAYSARAEGAAPIDSLRASEQDARMGRDNALAPRAIGSGELGHVRRILDTSEYIYTRFAPDELPGLLARLPATGLFRQPSGRLARLTGGALIAFLPATGSTHPAAGSAASASPGAKGRFEDHLDALLPARSRACRDAGATRRTIRAATSPATGCARRWSARLPPDHAAALV